MNAEGDERPPWAARMRAERAARDWSQVEAVRALRAHSTTGLPDEPALLRNWKRWESGTYPDDFYRPLIAKTFGTVTEAMFPREGHRNGDAEILAVSGTGTLEIISRIRASDINQATLDAVAITVDRLCSEYPHMSASALKSEGQDWLRRITRLLDGRLTLDQHREVLSLAGWLALLVGCVEYDLGEGAAAEATRRAALSLGTEAGNSEIVGWAHEMTAWFAVTQGDFKNAIVAADAGMAAAGNLGVSVQLSAQAAKAWARIGDRRQLEVALDQGRGILEAMPPAGNLAHHFVVDPAKFDFYAMDCYRVIGEDKLAENYARATIQSGTLYDGSERSPMRNAEARFTLGVVAARSGDLERAVAMGEEGLEGTRRSLPSLLVAARELAYELRNRFAAEAATADFVDHLRSLRTQ
jgi:hypothetical protein